MANGQPAFLGRGLLRPFRRDKKNDFAVEEGADLVKACVGQVLGTRADSNAGPGELPWRTEFGSRLHLLRHKNNSAALAELATVYAIEALGQWERRVSVQAVGVDRTTKGTLVVRVRYNLVDQAGRVVLADQATIVPVT